MNTRPKLLAFVSVIIFVASCTLPNYSSIPVDTPLIPKTGMGGLPTISPTLEALPATTFTPVALPTINRALEPTSTGDSPTATVQPIIQNPYVFAPQNTNCRLGPDVIYPAVGFLMKDETSEIVARNPLGTWVAINNLDAPGICYVALGVVEVHGLESITLLMVFTPLPPPTLTSTLPPPTSTPASPPPVAPASPPTITYTPELPTAPNPDDPRLNVNPGTGPAGTVFTFEIRDFKPSEQVTIVIKNYDGLLITSFVTTMNENGDKDETWTSPGDLPVSSYSVIPTDSTNKEGRSGTFLIIPTN